MNTKSSPETYVSSDASGKRRRSLLNKFLSKTYHMLDQCPNEIASWSDGGDSFTIKDVDAFEAKVLPTYFKHSKFSSFIRQLNFYGFNKQRSDPDLQTRNAKAVRFSHEHFRRGQPELLHRIQRTTASRSAEVPPSDQVQELQQQIEDLKRQLNSLENHIDDRVDQAVQSLERNYLARIQKLEQTYATLLAAMLSQYKTGFTKSPYLRSISLTVQSAANLADLSDYFRTGQKKL